MVEYRASHAQGSGPAKPDHQGQRPGEIGLEEVGLQDSSSLDCLGYVSWFVHIQIQFQLQNAV